MLGNSYLPVGEIITAAAQELRDGDFSHGLGRPFYLSAAQRALTAMNYETGFYKKIFNEPIPESLIIDLPEDMTAKDQIYIYRGDTCSVESSTILFVKPNMFHFGGDSGYIAQNKGRNRDALQYSLKWSESPPTRLFFCGEYNGKLYLSPSCLAAYERIFIPYSGIGVDCFGEDFKVPMWAREAITDWVIHRIALALEREDVQFYRGVIARKENELKGPMQSWKSAINLYKRSDKKQRYDTSAYTYDFGRYF